MAANASASQRTFVALIGDVPASAITRTVAATYRSDLLALPRDYDKAARWRSLTLPEVVEIVRRAQSSEPPEKIRTLSTTTTNKHLTNLSTYWGWLQDTGRIAKSLANPFSKLKTKRLRGRAARQLRPMWPKELEAKLFSSPVWTGCRSIHRRSRPGAHIFRDALFWLPLLGRTMGARSDELCSRAVGDVRFEGDVVYLAIRDTKNQASDRDVPIPTVILEFGFLEFRFYGRDATEPLFPELIGQGVAGRHSEAFGNRFSHYRRQIGAYSAKVDFHSFRHNITTDLENEPGINPGWIDEITGHTSLARISESTRYTKLVYLRNLRAAVDRISLPIDLSHLKYQSTLACPVSALSTTSSSSDGSPNEKWARRPGVSKAQSVLILTVPTPFRHCRKQVRSPGSGNPDVFMGLNEIVLGQLEGAGDKPRPARDGVERTAVLVPIIRCVCMIAIAGVTWMDDARWEHSSKMGHVPGQERNII